MINKQPSLLCESHVLGVENVCALLFVESEFPKCHVLLLDPSALRSYLPFLSLHPSLESSPLLQFSVLFEGKPGWKVAFYLSSLLTSLLFVLHSYLLLIPSLFELFSQSTSVLFSICSFPCLLHCFLLSILLSVLYIGTQISSAMWWWLLGVLSCVLLAGVIIFFLTTGQRYKVFNEKCLRPAAPLITDSRQRDDRLKRGKKLNCCW